MSSKTHLWLRPLDSLFYAILLCFIYIAPTLAKTDTLDEFEVIKEQTPQVDSTLSTRPLTLDDSIDLFPIPLLLGQWHFQQKIGPNKVRNYWLELKPNYQYEFYSYQNPKNVIFHSGAYSLDQNQIKFNSEKMQQNNFKYTVRYNQLLIEGALYTRSSPHELVGHWMSVDLKGEDIDANQTKFVEITLFDDALFTFTSVNRKGIQKQVEGIYAVTGEHLIFFYRNGTLNSQFKMDTDKLKLKTDFAQINLIPANTQEIRISG